MPLLFTPVVKFASYSGVEVSDVFGVSKFFFSAWREMTKHEPTCRGNLFSVTFCFNPS